MNADRIVTVARYRRLDPQPRESFPPINALPVSNPDDVWPGAHFWRDKDGVWYLREIRAVEVV